MPRNYLRHKTDSSRRKHGKISENDVENDIDHDRTIVYTVNDLLAQTPIDVGKIRKIAAVCGLSRHSLRARVWPLLLGTIVSDIDLQHYRKASKGSHKDKETVHVRIEMTECLLYW